VIADSEPDSAEFLAWYQQLGTMPGVVGTAIRPDTPLGIAVVDITPAGTSQGREASALVDQLRNQQPAFETEIGGIAAELIDIKDRLIERLPWAAFLVVLATLVLLFLMTGSIIVPIKAVVMNILSLAASFGALAWFFQEGHLAGVIGFDPVGALDLLMPVLILIFAFGLSMDYEVFLLSRIKEVRRNRKQRPRRRRRPAAQRPHHHIRRAAHRHRLRRLRRWGGPRHQAARRRARDRRPRRRHHRANPARARHDETPRRAQLVGPRPPTTLPSAIRTARGSDPPEGPGDRRRQVRGGHARRI